MLCLPVNSPAQILRHELTLSIKRETLPFYVDLLQCTGNRQTYKIVFYTLFCSLTPLFSTVDDVPVVVCGSSELSNCLAVRLMNLVRKYLSQQNLACLPKRYSPNQQRER